MARRIIVSLLVTVVLLGVARRLSTRNPADIVVDAGGVRLLHRTVTEQVGPGQPIVSVRIEPARAAAPLVRWISSPSSEIGERAMVLEGDAYRAALPDLGKGKRARYWIVVPRDGGGEVRLPEDADSSLLIKYKGEVSSSVLVSHIAFMFGSFFFMVMSIFGAIGILRGREDKKGTVRMARWVLFCTLVGSWLFGLILNHQAFGPLWEGYPFGFDVTDNKTQLMFVFWLVSLLLAWGSFTGKGEERDRLGRKAFAWAVIASFIVSLVLFIVPHSI